VKEFAEGDMHFSEIDPLFLKRFKAWLKATRKVGDRPISDRTIMNHFVVIRSIFNQAISANLVDRKHYPFGRGKVVIKFPDSDRISSTIFLFSKDENASLVFLFKSL